MYCGRGRSIEDLGLGNPFSHKPGTARFRVKTLAESLDCYQAWLGKLLKAYQKQQTCKLEDWERAYLRRVIKLAKDIEDDVVTDLMCFCIDQENYQTDNSKPDKCHTQILYEIALEIK
ncbi:hypothetical protein H6S82_05110 [Planktothrix sp. FACHB-1355]|uniref:Uncharacterized protein n=1 Tax=Aerosakkonema funiforme FACHB-1375 TaxID=2949571 RepID=A0A926ZKD0_9CYAN|nr:MULTISPECIES: hypothetical protein [Oscillatoriales]MBD2185810.1 hypothetical protein [Aerosakkonema funiforme FACHB-1375]MBD3558234.1 hypothetical protein [Planktothrix sp. FACHB-1355]